MELLSSPWRPVRRLLLALDVLVIIAAVAATPAEHAIVAARLPLQALPPIAAQRPEYVLLAALVLPLWLLLASQLGLYRLLEQGWSLGRLVARVMQLHVVGFVALATVLYATQLVFNRSMVAFFLFNSLLGTFATRAALHGWHRYRYRKGTGRLRLLLVGEPNGSMRPLWEASRAAELPPLIIGHLAPPAEAGSRASAAAESPAEPSAHRADEPPRLGTLDDLESVLHDHPVDQVLFFRPCDRAEDIRAPLLVCETHGIPALLAVDVRLADGFTPRIASLFGLPFASLELHPDRQGPLAVKHGFDFLAALLGLLLLSPLLLLVALAILITTGRPVLFSQHRAGLRGRPFRMLKFRTMVADAEQRQQELLARNEMDGPVFKVGDDPRVTALGRWLRRTSIDELPQLLHVVTGTMSLVGPRPLPLREQRQIHGWHRRRLAMRPGITGPWQVGGRNDIGFQRWMELDLEYVDRWSLSLDARILLATIPVVLLRKGAR